MGESEGGLKEHRPRFEQSLVDDMNLDMGRCGSNPENDRWDGILEVLARGAWSSADLDLMRRLVDTRITNYTRLCHLHTS